MPDATVSTEPERYDLKTLPEGYVVIRRMSYGETLRKQELSTKIQFEQMAVGKDGAGGDSMAVMVRQMTQYSFAKCIIEHNLTDKKGKALDFKANGTLDILDPRVGDEINTYVERLHEFLTDQHLKVLNSASAQPSS